MNKPLLGAVCVTLFCISTSAFGTETEFSLNAQRFRPQIGDQAFVRLEKPHTALDSGYGTSIWMNYARRPLEWRPTRVKTEPRPLLNKVVTTNIVAFFSVKRLRLGLDLPVHMSVDGQRLDRTEFSGPQAGDLRLASRLSILGWNRPNVGEQNALGVSWWSDVELPTGGGNSWLSSDGLQISTGLTGAANIGPIGVGSRLGARALVRQNVTTSPESVRIRGFRSSPALLWGGGVSVAVWKGTQATVEVDGESHFGVGSPGLTLISSTAEITGTVRVPLTAGLSTQLGVGRGLIGGYGAPSARFVLGVNQRWTRKAPGPINGGEEPPEGPSPEDNNAKLTPTNNDGIAEAVASKPAGETQLIQSELLADSTPSSASTLDGPFVPASKPNAEVTIQAMAVRGVYPLSNATVALEKKLPRTKRRKQSKETVGSSPIYFTTGEGGEVTFELPQGTYMASVRKDGYHESWMKFYVQNEDPLVIEAVLRSMNNVYFDMLAEQILLSAEPKFTDEGKLTRRSRRLFAEVAAQWQAQVAEHQENREPPQGASETAEAADSEDAEAVEAFESGNIRAELDIKVYGSNEQCAKLQGFAIQSYLIDAGMPEDLVRYQAIGNEISTESGAESGTEDGSRMEVRNSASVSSVGLQSQRGTADASPTNDAAESQEPAPTYADCLNPSGDETGRIELHIIKGKS